MRPFARRDGGRGHDESAVLVFPGSNREGDVAQAIELVTGRKPQMVWHGDGDFEKTDLIVVPGGFSYGDYLRCGAMAAQSPVMAEVKKRAAQGVPVLGICNGFQIVTEAGPAAGHADAQREAEVRLRRRPSQGRDQPEPVHQPLPGRPGDQGPGGACRGQLLRRRGHAEAAGRSRPDRLPLLQRRRHGRRQAAIPTARSATSPASSTRPRR